MSDRHLKLKTKVTDVLNEARILVLGTQVLLGFQFQAVFHPGFAKLPSLSQWANLTTLALDLLVLGLLLTPTPYHRITDDGDDTLDLKHLTAQAIGIALPLLALSLGLDVALISVRTIGGPAAVAVGFVTLFLALLMWVVMGISNRPAKHGEATPDHRPAPLAEKIQTLLTESRVILPGAQALLGFQFAAMLSEKFDVLPVELKAVHLASLFLIAAAVILLIAPAAYHRLAADGEPRQDVDTFGARSVLAALIPLALGLSGDLYVVTALQAKSALWAAAAATAALLVFAGLWGAFPMIARRIRSRKSR